MRDYSKKIHYITTKAKYLCNEACGINPEKTTRHLKKVTCKNCLKRCRAAKRLGL